MYIDNLMRDTSDSSSGKVFLLHPVGSVFDLGPEVGKELVCEKTE